MENPTHTYASPGNYTITLMVRDAFGDVEDKTVTIRVTRNIVPPTRPTTGPGPTGARPANPRVPATAITTTIALVVIAATLLIRSRRPKHPPGPMSERMQNRP